MTSVLETISILKGLIVACHATEQACDRFAEATKDPKVKSVWREMMQQQGKMARELDQAVVRLGGDPRHGGVAGTSRLFWPAAEAVEDPASSVAGGPRDEAQREVYRRALQADLPQNVHMLVQRQHVDISAIRERVRQLEQAQSEQAGGKVKTKISRPSPRAETWFDI
jgi:uncharacterized protein (TIGR02284 family)